MTRRTNFEQWKLETRSRFMAWVAAKLFTFKQTGLDGFIKRQLLKPKRGAELASE